MPRPTAASVSLTAPVAARLRTLALRRSADAGRRLTLSDVLAAALTVAEAHPAEYTAALAALTGEDTAR